MHRPESFSWPKVMVHPDKTFGHHVHDALDLPGFQFSEINPDTCARVLHLVNLFRKRWAEGALYAHLTEAMPDSFFWALNSHAEFWQPEDTLYSSPRPDMAEAQSR